MVRTRHWHSRIAWLLLPFSLLDTAISLDNTALAAAPINSADLQGHWGQRCLQTLAQQGILSPKSDGLFRPNDALSRADYALTIQRAFPGLAPTQKPIQFRDVRSQTPAAAAIQYMQQTGFWVGESRNEFKPTDSLARSHAFAGLANGLRLTAKQPASKDFRALFKDGRLVPNSTKIALAAALEHRLVINYPDAQRLNPNQPIRRAELAAALCQAFPSTAALVPAQYIATTGSPARPTVPTPGKPGDLPTSGGFPTRPPIAIADVVIPDATTNPPINSGGGSRPPNPAGNGAVVIGEPVGNSVIISPGGTTHSVVISTPNPAAIAVPPRIPTQEIRAAWITNVDSTVLFNSRSLQDAMTDLQKLRFNTVYPVVWNWGYTLYPSNAAKRAIGVAVDPREPGLQGRDSLAEMVQQGRRHQIAVMPWFEFGFMAPADSELARRHPDWLTQRKDGSTVWQEGEWPRVWLNPFKPEVQDFILQLVVEMVGDYDVDGIQFDDHMGLPFEFGYDAYTIELYKKENPGKEPPADPKDPAWVRWRADKITEFMGRIFRAVKARKPNAIVSLSPNSRQFSYENSLQDWLTWQRLGYIEELVLQVYRTDPTSFEAELMQPEIQEVRMRIPVGIGILTGLKNKPVPMSLIERKIQIARDRGFAGVSFFFYETMWNLSNESRDERRSSFQTMFEPPVTRPSVTNGWIAY